MFRHSPARAQDTGNDDMHGALHGVGYRYRMAEVTDFWEPMPCLVCQQIANAGKLRQPESHTRS